ncbi:MAG: putative phage abortive infection protein [Bacteroidales bacterium]|nr:putative phage abortive infection protein [Bacteroidales bacterium]
MQDKINANYTMKNKFRTFDKLSLWLIGIAIFLIIIAFASPYLITKYSLIDFTETGQIGDTLGGIMNPFIGIASIIVMFLAFYMQYKANEIQKRQFKINQFESQFFEMLKTHKENIAEISVEPFHYWENDIKTTQIISGRRALDYIIEEINIAYHINKAITQNENRFESASCLGEAYSFVWNGIENKRLDKKYPENLLEFLIEYRNPKKLTLVEKLASEEYGILASYKPRKVDFIPFDGHSSSLGLYYRHLFQTVKYVVSKDFLTYEEKRNYLRILRASMSNEEQALLFYNWLSGYGAKWEDKDNHFLTDFRMIHNVKPEMIIEDFDLESIFSKIKSDHEPLNDKDTLFEAM